MPIQAIAVSDEIDPRIYSATVRERMGHVNVVLGCGDLPARYLEFLADALDRPVYYVFGNHAEEMTRGGSRGRLVRPLGSIDLGGRVVHDRHLDLILAGFPGSPRYGENEPLQYGEWEIYWMMARMVPRLLWNRYRHGRALDILVTHAPPRGVNDRDDQAHRGFEALRRFLRWFRPAYHLHGHVHLYDRTVEHEQQFGETRVINVFPYRVIEIESRRSLARHAQPATPASKPADAESDWSPAPAPSASSPAEPRP